jgi:hypothetical protein
VAAAGRSTTATADRLRWSVFDLVCTAFIATAAACYFAGELWLAGSMHRRRRAMGVRIVVFARVGRRLEQRLPAAEA